MADALDAGSAPVTEEQPPRASSGDKVMPLVDHLGELRSRLVKTFLAVVAGAAVGFFFADRIIAFLVTPLPTGSSSTSRLRPSSGSSWPCRSSSTRPGRSSRRA
jgi:hypothetical protein